MSDSPSPSMFIAPRDAKCSRPRCSLAGHDVFSQRHTASPSARCSVLPQRGHVVGISHGCAVRRPPAQHRTDDARNHVAGLLDRPPSRLRGCPCGRCRRRCAASPSRWCEPARNTGSSTANGVTAPVRPTFTSILLSSVVFCSAGNLNAIAQRGNLLVAPERPALRDASTLMTTPSVSKSSDAALLLPLAQKATSCSMPRSAASAARPAVPTRAAARACRACVAGATKRARHDLVEERAQAAPGDQRRIEVAHRAGRGVPRILEQRLARLFALGVHPLEGLARQVHLAAHLDAAAGRRCRRRSVRIRRASRSRSGIARMVRTLGVTSSPRTPSPRVAPRTSTPSS